MYRARSIRRRDATSTRAAPTHMRAAEPNARHCAKWRRATGPPAICTMLALPCPWPCPCPGTNPWRGQAQPDPASSALEGRLALLHEGAAALDVVLACKAGLDRLLDRAKPAVLRVIGSGIDGELGGLDGERRIAGDRGGKLLNVTRDLSRRHDAIDEAHDARILSAELARGEEDLLGESRTDDVDELFDAGIAIAEPQPCRRHGKYRIGGANAQVGRERDGQSSADADTADHGNGGLQGGVEGCMRRIAGLIVNLDGLGVAALLLEF